MRKHCWVVRLEDARLPAEVGAGVRKAIEAAVVLAEKDAAGASAEASEQEPFTVNDANGAKCADALEALAAHFDRYRAYDALLELHAEGALPNRVRHRE